MLIKSNIHLRNSSQLLDFLVSFLLTSKVSQLQGSMTAMRRSHLRESLTFLGVIHLQCLMTEMHRTNRGLLQAQVNKPTPITGIVSVLHKIRQGFHPIFLALDLTLCSKQERRRSHPGLRALTKCSTTESSVTAWVPAQFLF